MTEQEIAEKCIADIRGNMVRLDAVATGATYRSLDYEAETNHLVIFMDGEHAPAKTLQQGSGPHYNREPTGFVEAIRKWVEVRFRSVDPYRRESLTWAIVKKIRKEGTQLWRSGETRDVYSGALERAAEDFAQMVTARGMEAVFDSIDKTFK